MKDFTNYNYDVNKFAYKDEARIRHISLKSLIIILIIAYVIFAQITEAFNLDLSFSKDKYTISEIREMAEDALDEAEARGYYSIYLKEEYIERILEQKGVDVEKYNITVDFYDNVYVEAK